ncbi:PP2C family protein-serine/threonine phosphatase [Aquicoccus sp. G2-2]|uniref:PP2C family protein-serine/threonine phosphatase n=1 Tax=Aquicoccus sp. G2-2 TaxID=3092120 RepID=UPI002ADFAEB4|nr:PP2C family protein-serine/threonine phosphatase [Aquicoccus sp. G2-2]MEA1114562.1 PP2C family protein-serine/threonine phosphatase [Aquicoccus sp. G2-2]
MFKEMETEHYFTLFLADLDLTTGHVRMAQAGHPHPLIQRASGAITQQGPGGLPVGLIEGAQYEEFETILAPGDRLLICSDGFIECPNPSNELLGEKGLKAFMTELKNTSGPELLDRLIWKLASFARRSDFYDDVSAVLLEFQGSPVNSPPA